MAIKKKNSAQKLLGDSWIFIVYIVLVDANLWESQRIHSIRINFIILVSARCWQNYDALHVDLACLWFVPHVSRLQQIVTDIKLFLLPCTPCRLLGFEPLNCFFWSRFRALAVMFLNVAELASCCGCDEAASVKQAWEGLSCVLDLCH